jgi:hypothetical protein
VLGIGKIVSPIPGIAGGEENYFVNKPGVFYPKIKMRPGTAVPAVFAKANGYVPFPDGPFYRCPQSGGGGCVRRSALKEILLNALSPQLPPAGYAAHHILPYSWCGSNSENNGVFLPPHVANDAEDDVAP